MILPHGVKKSAFFAGLFFVIIFSVMLLGTAERGASAASSALHLIYSSDMAGYLEPCG